MPKKKSPKKKKLSKIKAREILLSTLKENFGDRKEQTRRVGDPPVSVVIPGFPKRVKVSHRFKEDLGLDSLDLTELAMDAEEKYSEYMGGNEIFFDAEDIKSISTVGDAIDFFVKAVNERAYMTKEEYEKKIKEKFNFSDMGIKEKNEL
tara:strand:+ start:1781 stop:2227 length:447 start_codon:yes stop_codon:yes gene_type:complete